MLIINLKNVSIYFRVDFHKLPPDSDLIKESKVLQAILDEKLIKPQKKISAFLQLPKRPKIKPPKEIKPKGIPYLPLKYKGKKALQEEEEEKEKEKQEQEQEQLNTASSRKYGKNLKLFIFLIN